MSESRRVLLLILIMAAAALMVGGIAVTLLYQTAFKEAESRLVETAQSQARLLEAVARFDAVHSRDYPGGAREATLSQSRDAHEKYTGLGKTGEFTLAQREGDYMVFLLSHRHGDRKLPEPIPFNSDLAEPMRRSLSGQSGTVVGLDYRGEVVLAAYEPVAKLDWGIVAKIDLAEIRAPFVTAGLMAMFSGILIVVVGAILFVRMTNPLLRQVEESEQLFRSTFEQATVGIAHATPDGRFTLLNQRFCDITGYAQEELLALTFRDITHADDLEIDEAHVQQLLAGEISTYSMEKRFIRKDSSIVWTNLTETAVYDSSGALSHLMGVVEDIDERKQFEEDLRRKATVDQVRAAIFELDEKADMRKILISLCEALRDFGMNFEECSLQVVDEEKDHIELTWHALGGWHFHDSDPNLPKIAIPPSVYTAWKEKRPIYRPNLDEEDLYNEKIAMRTAYDKEIQSVIDVPFSHGTVAVNSLQADAFSARDIEMFAMLADAVSEGFTRYIDITERRRAEEELRKHHDHLEHVVERRTEKLTQTNEQLQQEIIERQRTEEQITAALSEKEVLLRELHHRVKNNLQIISSLLDLQASHIEDETTLGVLRNSSHRVYSMGLIHERLYQSTDLIQINFADYIRTLSVDLVGSYNTEAGTVSLEFQLEETTLGIDEAISCGLIVNELVTNAIQHAFPLGEKGTIGVGLKTNREDQIALTVWDNGRGIPPEMDLFQATSLGLTLVKSLVGQLGGKIEIDRHGGTKFTVILDRKT